MPATWIPNTGSQLERAIAALLLAARTTDWSELSGAARQQAIAAALAAKTSTTAADIYVTNDPRNPRPCPLTDILAEVGVHNVENSGNEAWTIQIANEFAAATQPGQHNPGLNRVELDTRIGKQKVCMMQGDNGSQGMNITAQDITDAGRALASNGTTQERANNVDMTEFTCQFVRYSSHKRGDAPDGAGGVKSGYWLETLEFQITACPSAVTGYSNDPDQ